MTDKNEPAPVWYRVLTADSSYSLESDVHKALREGFQLLGGVSVASFGTRASYAQAVFKPQKPQYPIPFPGGY